MNPDNPEEHDAMGGKALWRHVEKLERQRRLRCMSSQIGKASMCEEGVRRMVGHTRSGAGVSNWHARRRRGRHGTMSSKSLQRRVEKLERKHRPSQRRLFFIRAESEADAARQKTGLLAEAGAASRFWIMILPNESEIAP